MEVMRTKPSIKTITQKLLKTSHTQMECDSLHITRMQAKKSALIYIPSGWNIVLRMAHRNKPHRVVPLKHTNMTNLKKIASTKFLNTKTDVTGKGVNWLHNNCIQFIQKYEDFSPLSGWWAVLENSSDKNPLKQSCPYQTPFVHQE